MSSKGFVLYEIVKIKNTNESNRTERLLLEKQNINKQRSPDNFNGNSAILLGSSGVPNGKGLGPKWNGWNPWFPANELNNRPNTRFNWINIKRMHLCANKIHSLVFDLGSLGPSTVTLMAFA